MKIGIPKEIAARETRVAMTPANVTALAKKGVEIMLQTGAGEAAGYTDAAYKDAGATLVDSREQVIRDADVICQVQSFGCHDNTDADLALLKEGQVVIGMMDPLAAPAANKALATKGVTSFAMELIPRISRAQSMDVLSSMATLSGYKAVLLGASTLGRIFPMLMTAAGTLTPSKVFIMGVGVAGLQACATAKRLGAVVSAYDVRPAAREQIISVGATPVELDLKTENAEGKGGYAAEQSPEFIARQQELMGDILAEQDIIITTAAVPGAKSPILVTAAMVKKMKPGTVIIDLAAERGGNCELTRLNETVIENGVIILGPENVPSTIPFHASQMYGKNIENLLGLMIDDEGQLKLDFEDEIISETVISHGGKIRHPRIRGLLGLETKEGA